MTPALRFGVLDERNLGRRFYRKRFPLNLQEQAHACDDGVPACKTEYCNRQVFIKMATRIQVSQELFEDWA